MESVSLPMEQMSFELIVDAMDELTSVQDRFKTIQNTLLAALIEQAGGVSDEAQSLVRRYAMDPDSYKLAFEYDAEKHVARITLLSSKGKRGSKGSEPPRD